MKHLTHIVLTCATFFIAQATFAKSRKPNDKPNVIWIITDEHNFRTLGCYRELLDEDQAYMWGKEAYVSTPNIDKIAHNGTLFDRMYSSAPVCMPSRASMFTGQYPHTLGIPNNSSKPGDGKYLHADVTTIAQVVRKAGYMTGYVGKWHLAEKTDPDEFWQPYPVGKPGYNYGWQYNKYMFNGGHDKYKGIDAQGKPYRADKNPTKIGTDKYGQTIYKDDRSEKVKFTTDWLADRALEFIDANKAKPFFCVVSIPDPHTPNAVRAPYNTMFDDVEVKLPHTFKDNNVGTKNDAWRQAQKTDDQKKLIHDIRQYFGMVKDIDDNVGRILDKLEQDHVMENTIVLFSSDHGDLLGEHARVNKGTIHEASAKIPFVMMHGIKNNKPLVPRGKVITQAGNTTDWMPTFLSLLNVDCPKVPGRDLSPLFSDKAQANWHDVTFVRKGFLAAVTSQYKLYCETKGETWLLDMKADPDENINFIDYPAYKDVAKRMAKELKHYMLENNDPNEAITAKLNAIIQR